MLTLCTFKNKYIVVMIRQGNFEPEWHLASICSIMLDGARYMGAETLIAQEVRVLAAPGTRART